MMRFGFLLLCAVAMAGCTSINDIFDRRDPEFVGATDPTLEEGLPYDIEIEGLPEEEGEASRVRSLIQAATRLYRLKDRPPANRALIDRRAQGDVGTLVRILKSEGYYEAEAAATLVEDSEPPLVRITLQPGPQYTMEAQEYVFDPTPDHLLALQAVAEGVPPLDVPARGALVVDNEQNVLRVLNTNGRPYAVRGDRRARANFDTDRLSVRTQVDTGPDVVYGPITVEGAETVKPDYIAEFAEWEPGAPVSLEEIRTTQRELAVSRLFNSARVSLPEEPPEQEGDAPVAAPILIEVEEAKHRTVGGGLRYSTSDGFGGRAFWEHRNLLGEGEALRFDLDVAQNAQTLNTTFRKPHFRRRHQTLNANLRAYHETSDAFDTVGAAGAVGIERRITPQLSANLGVGYEVERIDDGQGRGTMSYLVGLPGGVTYDTSDDLLNPTEGVRLQYTLAPWGGVFNEEGTAFLVSDMTAATYVSLDRDSDYILAGRARGAAIAVEEINKVPATRRLYSGGGGSIRGFRSQFVGRLDRDGTPIGGLTVGELGLELRARFGAFGVVPFIEAGVVGQDPLGDFDTVRVGAGLGLRYYSPVGPIRIDVAFPITGKRPQDDDFQLYFSIGQAF